MDNMVPLELMVNENGEVLCPYQECLGIMRSSGTMRTLVGNSHHNPGHYHDLNCYSRKYVCKNNHQHMLSLSVIKKCPVQTCEWKPKTECFCHPYKKLERWPENEEEFPTIIKLIPKD